MINLAAAFLALADIPAIEFVGYAVTAAAATNVTKPTGLEAGDLVIIHGINTTGTPTLATASGSTWTKSSRDLGGGNWLLLFSKFMTATDLANAWTLSAGLFDGPIALAYRSGGANAVAVASIHDQAGGATLSLPGFTRAAGHYGVISILADANGTVATPPVGFSQRYSVKAGAIWRVSSADQLLGYVDGAAVVWSGLSGGAILGGWLLEVTGP